MQNLPKAEIYEQFYHHTTWKALVDAVAGQIRERRPAKVLDLCCGTGLLSSLVEQTDYLGVDLEPEYIGYAQKRYFSAQFVLADARTWNTDKKFDLVVCLGGVHHLPDNDQEAFIARMKEFLSEGGGIIIGDPYISDYHDARTRKLQSVSLGLLYLYGTVSCGAPDSIIDAVHQIIKNDIFLVEWKTSFRRRMEMVRRHFRKVQVYKTWPHTDVDGMFGDYYFVLSN